MVSKYNLWSKSLDSMSQCFVFRTIINTFSSVSHQCLNDVISMHVPVCYGYAFPAPFSKENVIFTLLP